MLFIYLLFMGLCVCVYVSDCHKFVGSCRGQKKGLDPMELELQVAVSCRC